MKSLPGAAKQAKFALKRILTGEPVDIMVREYDDGHWVAWISQCGEDEFGFCSKSDTPEHALWRLSADFQRVVHKARHPENSDAHR